MIGRAAVCVVLAMIATAGLAQENAPETSPAPQARPATPAPIPPADDVPTSPPDPETPPEREMLAESPAALALCLAALDRSGAVYERIAPIVVDEAPDCGIANPLMMTFAADGVALTPAVTMRCDTALALATWVDTFVQPAATLMGERGKLTGMTTGTGTDCRSRNNAPGADLSEHAFGNAVDIMTFTFSGGDPVAVEPREREGTMAEAFQRAVRAGACMTFTTVLGPGSDAAHDNHLHLDIKDRNGGFRLCQ